jgi:NADPH2:quinone reductase
MLAGQPQPNIAAHFALSDGAQAHAYLVTRQVIGKVLLTL